MAEDDDNNLDEQGAAKTGTDRPAILPSTRELPIAEAVGPCCVLTQDGQRPLPGQEAIYTSEAAQRIQLQIKRDIDSLAIVGLMDELCKVVVSPSRKISQQLGGEILQLLVDGVDGILPLSWLNLPLEGPINYSYRTTLLRPEVRAVAYGIAAERGYINDPKRQMTVTEFYGVESRTRSRWIRNYRDLAEMELELLLLQAPRLLDDPDATELKQILLQEQGVTLKVPEMSE